MSAIPTNLRYYPRQPWELCRADYLRRNGRPLEPEIMLSPKRRRRDDVQIKDDPNPASDDARVLKALQGRSEERDGEVEGLKRRVAELEAIVRRVSGWVGANGDANGR